MNLALNQELFELALFNDALARFSPAEFNAGGISNSSIELIRFMATQEIAHAETLRVLIGVERAALSCDYVFPYVTVKEFITFAQLVTKAGESGVLGKSNETFDFTGVFSLDRDG